MQVKTPFPSNPNREYKHPRIQGISIGTNGAMPRSQESPPSDLIFHLVFRLKLALLLQRVAGNLLVVTLQGSKVLTGLGEFTFLHTLTNVPVNEGTLGVHEVELVVESGPSLGDGGSVGQHATSEVSNFNFQEK